MKLDEILGVWLMKVLWKLIKMCYEYNINFNLNAIIRKWGNQAKFNYTLSKMQHTEC